MKYEKEIETKIGTIVITQENANIVRVEIQKEESSQRDGMQDTPLLRETEKQILQYLEGSRKEFTVPLAPKGTDFQKKVWKELLEIPYGEIRSYGEIAEAIGNPKGARAIGMANHKNPIPIMIPCHRVVGKNGDLVGYALGIEIKKELLQLEGYLS